MTSTVHDVPQNDEQQNDEQQNDGQQNDEQQQASPAAARRFGARRVLLVVVALAAVAALVSGVLWLLAVNSGSLALSRDRDAVLVDAKQAAINMNTLDYKNVDAGLALWEQSSTGDLLAQIQKGRAEYAKAVSEAKRSTVATVPDAAVVELGDRAGVARVLVAIDVTVTPEGQAPVVSRQRLQLQMARTPEGWKVSNLSPVRAPTAGTGN